MNAKYWDGVATTYDDQVFNTLASDSSGIIGRSIDRIASKQMTVADFGCGVGKYVRLLSSQFRNVVAIDHSARLLDVARKTCGELSNVEFIQADLTDRNLDLPVADAAISINVLLTPDAAKRAAILETVYRSLQPGGRLVLVVPALESSLYSISVLAEWNRRSRNRHSGVSAQAVAGLPKLRRAVFQGVISLDDQPTKHFLREEIESLVSSVGFQIDSSDKVEYSWGYEFDRPPRWMKRPYPWDWILNCTR
jgi:ubiquinone/menaquinone biosynthesis C-methylase UbiE